MPRRYNPIDKSWVVNVLTHGDLEGTLRPNAVRINRYLEGPNEDGSFASSVDDGKVYISALFLASAVKYFEHRYAEVAQSPPDIFKTRVCLQKYKVIHKLHENLNLCEFWLEVEQFVDWNPDDAFFHKGCLIDCMAVQEVRERSHRLWQESLASQANSSVPFTQVMCRLGREDILSQAEGIDPDLKAYFVNSFWTEPFHIEDFLISDEDKKQLSLIEEWQDDYKPPVTPSDSLASGSSSVQERGNMDEGKEGSPPSQLGSAPRQEGSAHRQEGSTPRQEGNTPRQEGNTPRQVIREQSTGEDSNSVSASGVEVAGRDSVPLIQTSPQQEVTSSSSIDEPSIVTATAGRPPSDVGNDTRDSVNISDVCVGRFQSVSVQVHASQDISQPLVSDRRMVHAGVQVGGLTGEDRQGGRTDDDSMELQDAQVVLSRDGSSDDGFHAPYLPKAHAGGNTRPSNMTLCPLVDGSLDVMLGCTDHSRESEHSRGSDRSRGSDQMDKDCSNSRDVVSTGAAMKNSSTKSHSTGCSDVRRLSHVRGAGVAVCSTQVNWCPLEQLPCLDVSAVDQSVTDSMCSVAPVTDTRTHGLRLYPADDILASRAECDILCVDWNGDVGRVRVEAKVHSKVQDVTKLDDVDNKKQRGHQQIGNETVDTMTERHNRNRSAEISEQQEEQRLVDTMTERHDRNSSEEILLSEQQEEQRLVDTMTERHDRNSSEEILLSKQQEEQRLVDTMTERHDRNSSEEILLSEQQEEQRLVDMTKTSTVVSDPLDEPMTEPDSPRHLSPVLISLAPPMLQSTRVTSDREPVICIPLSGSETFTQMPRQKRHESGSRWDVGVLYEPKHQRKHRRARKLYTEAVLLPTKDPPIPADWADDDSLSRKGKSCLTDRNEATSCSQPDNCMIISSSSEHCTPASPVDDIARSNGNTISSTNNDSVESSDLDGAAVQRLERLLSVEVMPIQQKILELDFTEKDPSLVGFTTTYFMQQKFDYNT